MFLTAFTGVFATAQSPGDINKGEFYLGYSNGQVDTGIDSDDSAQDFLRNRANFHGFEVAGVYNVSRYVGLKGDVSGTYNSTQFTFPVVTGPVTQTVTFDTSNSLYNFLGGVQIKDNASTGRVKPFAHVLVGAGHARTKIDNLSCVSTPNINCGELARFSQTGLAGAFGGGLDVRLNDRVDLRAFQVDYNPMKFDGRVDHNIRLGIGFVIK